MNRTAIKVALGSFALLLASSAWAAGEFTRSCKNIDLRSKSALDATCRTMRGSHARTGIQLNNYIANIDGDLRWKRNGNYSASSRNCDLDRSHGTTILRCDTRRIDGSWTSSSLNLDSRIANINGRLQYQWR